MCLSRPADAQSGNAQEFAADLLVMGCYGHSRLRETILGGVTHDMLRDAPIPLLLSS